MTLFNTTLVALLLSLPQTLLAQNRSQSDAPLAATASTRETLRLELDAELADANTSATTASVFYVLHVVALVGGLASIVGANIANFGPSSGSGDRAGIWPVMGGILGAASVGFLITGIAFDVEAAAQRHRWRAHAQATDSVAARFAPYLGAQGAGVSLHMNF